MNTKGNNSEAKAYKELKKMPIEHLRGGSERLGMKAMEGRLSNGERTCRRRMQFVLARKENDAEFAKLANKQRPQQPSVTERPRQNPQQQAYDEAYLEGEEERGGFRFNPYEQTDIKYWAFVDGKAGRPRNLQEATERAAQFGGRQPPRSSFLW